MFSNFIHSPAINILLEAEKIYRKFLIFSRPLIPKVMLFKNVFIYSLNHPNM